MREWIAIVLLGIVEGITEFLPVSSTGHLLIVEHWLPRQTDLFNIVIQSGAVLAVLPLFRDRLGQFIFRWREKSTQDYLAKLTLAFILTGGLGYLVEKRGFKLPEQLGPVAWALLVGGLGFLAVELWLRGRRLQSQVTWGIAIAVGLGQVVAAIFPGASRSGTTIILCLLLGLTRPAATEFCFLVGIPTMLAAGGLKILKAMHHGGGSEHWGMVGLGFVVSAIVSFLAVKWLLRYVQSHTFVIFGWYRVALGIGLLLLVGTVRL